VESPNDNITPSGIITFTSDFGLHDPYVGQVKGVIYSKYSAAKIVDLTHQIRPQNIHQAAWTIMDSVDFFPPGTVHLVVVDPGVGSERRPIALQSRGNFFVGPDNGVFSAFYPPDKMVTLDNTGVHLLEVSPTFHGRDIFAPCAALLAKGYGLHKLGSQATDPVTIKMPSPDITQEKITGEIVQVDHFGNLITNIYSRMLNNKTNVDILVGNLKLSGISSCYSSSPANKLVALVSSNGRIEIAAVNSSAARILGSEIGEKIEIYL
jgi:S-adenosyl-L-methionine hydrolase (adenosine-forming)